MKIKYSTKFRKANAFELDLIWNGLQKLSLDIDSDIINQKFKLFVFLEKNNRKFRYPSVYLLSVELSELYDELSLETNIIAAGIYFGFIKKSIFRISIEGAEFLVTNNIIKEYQAIVVDKKAEKAILYGNNISKDMILSEFNDYDIRHLFLIYNQLGELIALGKFRDDLKKKQDLSNEEIIIRNYIDKGYYLRKEK
ncbi:MAG: hypothetical protein GF353_00435 [Candidatus Lokiarchaeota archaeon]|nr:hypothetical protein [Candidatus Lokiarchaeota archaeon]